KARGFFNFQFSIFNSAPVTSDKEVNMPATTTQPLHEKYSLRAPREYKNYVDGEWVKSKSGKTFDDINPANSDDQVGTFQESNADDVRAAVDAAERAYKTWRLVPAPKRAEYLYRVGAILQ